MNINSLPDDVLVKVFSKISLLELVRTVRLTCLRWRSLSYDFYLWRVVHFNKINVYKLLVAVTENADSIENVTLLGCCFRAFNRQNLHFPKLKRLKIVYASCICSSDDLNDLISACPSLQDLVIVDYESDIVLQGIMKLKNLCHLEIRSNLISDPRIDFTIDMFAGFPNLNTLVLSCNQIKIPDDVINAVFGGSPYLKNIGLSWYHLTRNAFRDLSPLDNKLESLILWDAESLTDEDFLNIVKKMPHLKALTLYFMDCVTEKSIVYLADTCRELESLEMHGEQIFTEKGMKALADGCPNLRKFFLPHLPDDVGDEGIVYLAERCRNLEHLNIERCSIIDDSMLSLCIYASNLKVLRLSEIKRITGYAVSQVILNCRWLRKIRVRDCNQVKELNFDDFHQKMTPFGRKPLPECTASCLREKSELLTSGQSRESGKTSCQVDYDTHLERRPIFSNLKTIEFYGTPINNRSFLQIARHCPDLVQLCAFDCNLQDDAAVAITKNCLSLRGLAITGDLLTDVGLRAIAEFGTNLTEICIPSSHRGPFVSLQQLVSKLSELKSV